jgi:acetyl esterase
MKRIPLSVTAVLGAAAVLLAGCAGNSMTMMSAAPMGAAAAQAPAPAEPAMQAVLDALAKLGPKPIETLAPAEARRQPTPADAVNVVLKDQGRSTDPTTLVPGVRHVDRMITGAAGQIPARIYTPPGNGPFPVIVYFHGGGWVIADKQVYDGGARGLAKESNAVVVSVDYRLAPENRFPASWDDSLAAYRWALANAASIQGDPRRIALAGESAGGNLAVATAIAARDARLQLPMHVLSVYPIAQTDMNTPSYQTYQNAKPLDRPMMQWFAGHTIRSQADLKDPRMQLVDAQLRGLPPVTIINAQIDPLLDDGAMLEAALKRAGVPVQRRVYEGVTHEFFGMAAVVPKAKDAQSFAGQRMRQMFEAG